jgi:hypothetical protein
MAAGVWRITELRRGAQGGAAGETFVWSADTSPPTPNGGGRCAPKAPWTIGGQHAARPHRLPEFAHAERADPRAREEAVHARGAFDDRYNFAGYAVGEMRRLEAMMERGNLCRIHSRIRPSSASSSTGISRTDAKWQIGYVLHVRRRTSDRRTSTSAIASPDLEMSPAVMFDALDLACPGRARVQRLARRAIAARRDDDDRRRVVARVAWRARSTSSA